MKRKILPATPPPLAYERSTMKKTKEEKKNKIQLAGNKGKKDALTKRERLFFKALTKSPGITIAEAGRRAGYAESTIRGTIYNKIAKDRFQEGIAGIMEEKGLTDDKIMDHVMEGLEAIQILGGEEIADHKTRHRFIETILKLKGLVVTRTESKSTSIGVQCNVDQETLDRLAVSMGLISAPPEYSNEC